MTWPLIWRNTVWKLPKSCTNGTILQLIRRAEGVTHLFWYNNRIAASSQQKWYVNKFWPKMDTLHAQGYEAWVLSSGKTKDVLHCSQYSRDSSIRFYVNEVGTTLNNVWNKSHNKNTGFADMSDDGEHLQYFRNGPAHA